MKKNHKIHNVLERKCTQWLKGDALPHATHKTRHKTEPVKVIRPLQVVEFDAHRIDGLFFYIKKNACLKSSRGRVIPALPDWCSLLPASRKG